MALDESAILRRAQRLSAPTRRALSSGLEKALMSTRYQENPNVAGMLTEKALSGYGAGLSSAISAGEREALGVEQTEEQMRLEQERINMQRDAYSDQSDAASISGVTQLGLLGMTGYDLYNRWGGAATTAIGSGGTAAVGAGTKAVAGATAGAYTPAITGLNLAEGGIGPNMGYGADYLLGPEAALTYGGGETAAATGAMSSGAALTTIGAGIMAAPLLGPTITSFAKNTIAPALGMYGKSSPSGREFLTAIMGGNAGEWNDNALQQWETYLGHVDAGTPTTLDPADQLRKVSMPYSSYSWMTDEGSTGYNEQKAMDDWMSRKEAERVVNEYYIRTGRKPIYDTAINDSTNSLVSTLWG